MRADFLLKLRQEKNIGTQVDPLLIKSNKGNSIKT